MYLIGIAFIVGTFLVTLIFTDLLTPLRSLYIRLSVLTIGFLYFIALFLYFERLEAAQLEFEENEIIVMINGKELRL